MIPLGLIVLSAVLTAIAVAVAARIARWDWSANAIAALGAGTTVLLWRVVCNTVGWNDDFAPLISVADAGCLIAGGLAPAVAARRLPPSMFRWLPATVGAIAAFVINVLIL